MTSTIAPQAVAEPALRPLSVDEVIRMAEVGIIGEGERVELIDGRLVQMTPEGMRHRLIVEDVNRLLVTRYARPYRVFTQSTLPLDAVNFRQPDFVVIDAPLEEREARPDEIVLIVEISDSTPRNDLGPKARAYAAWGAADYWVIDAANARLVVHRGPGAEGYARVETLPRGASVALPRTDATIDVGDLLPPPASS